MLKKRKWFENTCSTSDRSNQKNENFKKHVASYQATTDYQHDHQRLCWFMKNAGGILSPNLFWGLVETLPFRDVLFELQSKFLKHFKRRYWF